MIAGCDNQSTVNERKAFRRGFADAMHASREQYEAIKAENEFLKSFLQSHSPQMSGVRHYKWRGGWLTNQLIGNGVDEAVRNAMDTQEKSG